MPKKIAIRHLINGSDYRAHHGASEWHERTVCIFEKAHAQVAEDEEANDGTADQGAECRIALVLAHAVAWSGLTPKFSGAGAKRRAPTPQGLASAATHS